MDDVRAGFRQKLKGDREQLQREAERAAASKLAAAEHAEQVRSEWPNVRAALVRAVKSINEDFANERLQDRMSIAQGPENRDGTPTLERPDIVHVTGREIARQRYTSTTDVSFRANGAIEVRSLGLGIERLLNMLKVTEADWRKLLEDIYERDKENQTRKS